MQNAHTARAQDPRDLESTTGFDARFRDLLAAMSDQDEMVAQLLEAQGLEAHELADLDALPEEIAEQLDDAADERIEDVRRSQAQPLARPLCTYALRA